MKPSTILLLALCGFCWLLVIYKMLNKPEPSSIAFTDQGIQIASNGEPLTPMFTNVPKTFAEWEHQLIEGGGMTPEQASNYAALVMFFNEMANDYRTNRTFPGVLTNAPDVKRFPLYE